MKWLSLFLFLILLTSALPYRRHGLHRHKKRRKRDSSTNRHEDTTTELRRMKRMLYRSLVKNKGDDAMDIDDKTTVEVTPNGKRPYVQKQIQEVQAEILLQHEWRSELANRTSPEYMLVVGNLVDALSNEFNANYHYLSSAVSTLRPTNSSSQILAIIAVRFYKTLLDPLMLLQGIVTKGWISNQQINPKYFKVLGVINGNSEKAKWHYPNNLKLRIIPAMQAPTNQTSFKPTAAPNITSYKEVRISIKLKQRFVMFLEQKNSPEFNELSGNIRTAITTIFIHDSLYIDVHVLEFSESEEGRVIVKCAVRFKLEERHAIEKCEAMISGGDLAGMPVDQQYFTILGMSEKGLKLKTITKTGEHQPTTPLKTITKTGEHQPTTSLETGEPTTPLKPYTMDSPIYKTQEDITQVQPTETPVTSVYTENPVKYHQNITPYFQAIPPSSYATDAAPPPKKPSPSATKEMAMPPITAADMPEHPVAGTPLVQPALPATPLPMLNSSMDEEREIESWKKQKPKPLRYKEIRLSIKMRQHWNGSFSSNRTKPYAIFSATIEEAIDRALMEESTYIDATVLDFMESGDEETIVQVAVRFQLDEPDPQQKLKDIITTGSLSGFPVDPKFFYVFALSETEQRPQTSGQKQQAYPPKASTSTMTIPANGTASTYTTTIPESGNTEVAPKAATSTMTIPANGTASTSTTTIPESGNTEVAPKASTSTMTIPANGTASTYTTTITESENTEVAHKAATSTMTIPANGTASTYTTTIPESGNTKVAPKAATSTMTIPANGTASTYTTTIPESGNTEVAPKAATSITTIPANGTASTYTTTIPESKNAEVSPESSTYTANVPGNGTPTTYTSVVPFETVMQINSNQPDAATYTTNIQAGNGTSGSPSAITYTSTNPTKTVVNLPNGQPDSATYSTTIPNQPPPAASFVVSNQNVTTYGMLPSASSFVVPNPDAATADKLPSASSFVVPNSKANATADGKLPPASSFVVTNPNTGAATEIVPHTNNPGTTYNPYLPTGASANPPATDSSAGQTNQKPLTSPAYETLPTILPKLNGQPLTNSEITTETLPLSTEPNKRPSDGASNEIEGFMTLQQSWHAYLADKTSFVYKGLERTIVEAIKGVYSESNEAVAPTILGFSEADVPSPYAALPTEKKVGVRFKVTFMAGHKAVSGPLERAVLTNKVAGLLILENSLVLVAPAVGHAGGPAMTICQQQQIIAESTSGATVGGFIPQCAGDGSYKTVQCHALTGYCWCVNKEGVRIQGTEERYKEPNCSGLRISGDVILPAGAPSTLPPESCLTILVQQTISCGGDVNCHIPITANKTVRNIVMRNSTVHYQMDIDRLTPGQYSLSAVLNVGWCRGNQQQGLVRIGDYHTTTMHNFVVGENMTKVEQDVIVEELQPEETGIRLDGHILLPEDTPVTSLPDGSCLSIQTKKLNLCTSNTCPELPATANQTITDLNVVNQSILYTLNLPELDPGTYILSAVLHMGQCPQTEQTTMLAGDYYNEQMHDYEVSPTTTEVTKNISVVVLKDEHEGTIVTGRVLLPKDTAPLPPDTCLTVSTRKLIQCKNENCNIPPIATKTFANVTNIGGIPYSLFLPSTSPGKYIISAVVNLGWCRNENSTDWIKDGDLYNDKIHDYEVTNETVVGRNIQVVPLRSEASENPGVLVHGDVILPTALVEISSRSCLTIKVQQFKLCQEVISCVQPLLAKETFRDFQIEGNKIPYTLTLPQRSNGTFIISATLNMGWCNEDGVQQLQEWIRQGDYHNEDIQDFILQEGDSQIEKDVEVQMYTEITTGSPTYPFTRLPITTQGVARPTPSLVTTRAPSNSVPHTEALTDALVASILDMDELGTAPSSFEDQAKQTVFTQRPPEYEDNNPTSRSTIKVPITQPIADAVPTTVLINATNATAPHSTEDDLIELPDGLPKSCEEIRASGIGHMDGQYIIEARKQCHLSIICQDMNEPAPREFLGGPSEDEWKYWHYAILIRMTDSDKKNIPTGACLENTDNGRDLLRRIHAAGVNQSNPLDKWRSRISDVLRSRKKRHIFSNRHTLMTKAKTLYKDRESAKLLGASDWGVL